MRFPIRKTETNSVAMAVDSMNAPSLAYKDTLVRRVWYLLALKTTARFYRRLGSCIPISKHLIVKTGVCTRLAEAAALQFVASKTSIPVPRVHCAFVHRGRAYIVMERIRGEIIGSAINRLSNEERSKIFAQLRAMIEELRSLPVQSDGIQSCTGGAMRDFRIQHAKGEFGPFSTTQDFHAWLRKGLQIADLHDGFEDRESLEKMIIQQDGPWPAPVFTHGDLSPFNILVRDKEIAGIIDWEFAGWYPPYWEYSSAMYSNLTRESWQLMLAEFLDTCDGEMAMEHTRLKWWGAVF